MNCRSSRYEFLFTAVRGNQHPHDRDNDRWRMGKELHVDCIAQKASLINNSGKLPVPNRVGPDHYLSARIDDRPCRNPGSMVIYLTHNPSFPC
jgi:hypothetical protein